MQREETPKKLTSLDNLSKLVNAGKWPKALRLVRGPDMESGYEKSVDYWFLRALIEGLRGSQDSAEEAQKRAEACPGYNRGVAEDLARDNALVCVRARMLGKAMEFRNKARALSDPQDENRIAALDMLDGRIDYAAKRYGKALTQFFKAHDKWRVLEKSYVQWAMNNRFYLLKALAAEGENVHDIAHIVIMTDPSPKRRLSARFIRRFGKLGNKIHDWAAQRLGV